MIKRLQNINNIQPSLQDVANRVGCSTATVSRVLNKPESVKAALRNKVMNAMEELGYLPNSAARALRSRRTHIMGIVIPTLNYAIYARLVEGLQQKLAMNGYSLLVATSDYNLFEEVNQARVLIERGVEGLVLVGNVHEASLYELLETSKTPYTNTYVYQDGNVHPCIGFDNKHATSKITEYLLNLGHTKFGVISAILIGNDRASERVAGVRTTLDTFGLSLEDEFVYQCPYSIAGGREGFRYLLSLKNKPTAIICGNDVLAMGALIEARSLSIQIPSAASIVGFDNLEFSAHLEPPLTTIDVPAKEMGESAAEYLVQKVTGRTAIQSLHLEPRLIVRKTSGPAPDNS